MKVDRQAPPKLYQKKNTPCPSYNHTYLTMIALHGIGGVDEPADFLGVL